MTTEDDLNYLRKGKGTKYYVPYANGETRLL